MKMRKTTVIGIVVIIVLFIVQFIRLLHYLSITQILSIF